MTADYHSIPSVDRVLAHPDVQCLFETYSRQAVTSVVRRQLEVVRQAISTGASVPSLDRIAKRVISEAEQHWAIGPRPVINATGVIIHTNLGRAPLSAEALDAVKAASEGYSNLEYDLEEGNRGSRLVHISELLCELTGAESALVVNNNAAAVMLTLATLAAGKEVIISRGEAVEIGGGFRIPDVLRQSGAVLVEVGTTNRTYAQDYQAATTPNTAAFLKVHASNFRVTGFTHTTDLAELAALAKKSNVYLLQDLGSGSLLNTEQYGLVHEPTPQESVAAGASITCFSTDKLLGGPQGGVVVGDRELVARIAHHPLARALRMDKMSLAALSATLLHYLKGEAPNKVPVWRMISMPLIEIDARAHQWQMIIGARASVLPGKSTIGGGSMPGETLATQLLAVETNFVTGGATEIMRRLRDRPVPVVARIVDERVVFDPRTVLPAEEPELLQAIRDSLV